VVEGLQNSAASMHQPTVEAAIAAAGFGIVRRERIGSEWTEHRLEHDPAYLTRDLLELARLTRQRDRFQQALGPVWYRRALAFDLWRLQIVLGRLVPVLYALVKGDLAGRQAPVTDPRESLPSACGRVGQLTDSPARRRNEYGSHHDLRTRSIPCQWGLQPSRWRSSHHTCEG
jgi:hypothetical protein